MRQGDNFDAVSGGQQLLLWMPEGVSAAQGFLWWRFWSSLPGNHPRTPADSPTITGLWWGSKQAHEGLWKAWIAVQVESWIFHNHDSWEVTSSCLPISSECVQWWGKGWEPLSPHSLSHSFIHSSIHSSFSHSFVHSLIYPLSFIHSPSFIHSCIPSFTHSSSFMCSLVHSLISSFTHSPSSFTHHTLMHSSTHIFYSFALGWDVYHPIWLLTMGSYWILKRC
jgi:hypothetical protein